MLEYGKHYHIYNRGNNRQDLFLERRNYEYFLSLYKKYIDPLTETFAYCLLKNHFHLMVKIKNIEELNKTSQVSETCEVFDPLLPSRQFSHCFNAYTKSINKAYDRTGSLFQDRFHRIEIHDDIYFARLIHYIHFNPQKHGLTADFKTYPHSSYSTLISDVPTSLSRIKVLQWFGGKDEFIQFHKNVAAEKEIFTVIGIDE